MTLLQVADPVIGPFLGFWKRQKGPNREERETASPQLLELCRQWNKLLEKDDTLYRRIMPQDGGKEIHQLVLPEVLREDVLMSLHDEHGHQGIERTTDLVRWRCYWPGMNQDVEQ